MSSANVFLLNHVGCVVLLATCFLCKIFLIKLEDISRLMSLQLARMQYFNVILCRIVITVLLTFGKDFISVTVAD